MIRLCIMLIASVLSPSVERSGTATPDAQELAISLAAARLAWGGPAVEDIQFRLEPLNDCDLRPGHTSRTAQLNTSDTQTTMAFDDGSPSVVSHHTTYVITVNTACDWRRLPLQNTITHEYGHILIGSGYHSANPNSVMYYIVNAKQKIMPEDRAMIAVRSPLTLAVPSEVLETSSNRH